MFLQLTKAAPETSITLWKKVGRTGAVRGPSGGKNPTVTLADPEDHPCAAVWDTSVSSKGLSDCGEPDSLV